MQAIIDTLSMAMSGILLWAGLEKCRQIEGIAAAIRALGLDRSAPVLAVSLAAFEIALALGLLFAPQAVVVQLGVSALALVFAAAGAWALTTGRRIRCNCFGSTGGQRLGANQLWALIPWLGAVGLLHIMQSAADDQAAIDEGTAKLAVVALMLAAVRAMAVVRAWHAARGDRLSAREMLVWLP